MIRSVIGTAVCLGMVGCIGLSPEQREQYAISDTDDGDESHLPGMPCLVCHREEFHPGDDEFQVAGTIYLTPTSSRGLGGVQVEVTDAAGRVAQVLTNGVGNFMVGKGDEDEHPREGRIKVRYRMTYPLRTRIRYAGMDDVVMESLSWREGSCAHCHALEGPPGETEPRVYVMETAP